MNLSPTISSNCCNNGECNISNFSSLPRRGAKVTTETTPMKSITKETLDAIENCRGVSKTTKIVSINKDCYNGEEFLKEWGFTANSCFNCGIENSDLAGLLLQCGKCKKAYYCGMKCFNAHLPEHQKYCCTETLDYEPERNVDTPYVFTETKYTDLEETPTPAKTTTKKKSTKDKKKKKKSKGTKKVRAPATPVESKTPVVIEPIDEPEAAAAQRKLIIGSGQMPEEQKFAPEARTLQHTEQRKHEYGWETPDWVDSCLRSTQYGQKLKDGEASDPVRDAICDEHRAYTPTVPEWANRKLRKSMRIPTFDEDTTPTTDSSVSNSSAVPVNETDRAEQRL